MPNLEYDVAHTLLTPGGNVDLNTTSGYRYMIQPAAYKITPSLRVTQDNISQADGSVLHPRWKTGLVATVEVSYWMKEGLSASASAQDIPACGSDLRVMHETLVAALNSIRTLDSGVQRLRWQPTGYGDTRLLDQIELLSWPDPSYDLDGTEASVTFAVESPFPYAIDGTQTTTTVPNAGTALCNNAGNADFSPVVRVNGPCLSGFTLTNLSDLDPNGVPRKVVYDTTRPGSLVIPNGHYAEIDFFRGTLYLDGNGANLIAAVDPAVTDFWHLLPASFLGAPNQLSLTGDAASATVLYNNAWA